MRMKACSLRSFDDVMDQPRKTLCLGLIGTSCLSAGFPTDKLLPKAGSGIYSPEL